MEAEEYLIAEKSYILALNELNLILGNRLKDNYYELLNGKINSDFLEEVLAINTAIKAVIYRMRVQRKECYKQIDVSYNDDFEYN